jgi:hypothetical protein
MEYHYRHVRNTKLTGEIEIDESLFGRRVKHNRGNPHRGLKIWIFGMVERDTVILYPVNDRYKHILVPLIMRHVDHGATIHSDGWSAYDDLNDLGYRHFSFIYKYSFKTKYRNVGIGDIVIV